MNLSKRQLFQLVGYKPHPGQELVHRSRAPRRVLACGARWGKTWCAAHEALAAILEPREYSMGWMVAPTYDLVDRCFRLLVKILETHFRHRIREIAPRDQRIVVTNLGGGVSEVRGKSADRPASLLGEALDWLVIDEAASLGREVWEGFLSQRLIDRKGWALIISTPKGNGWFRSMYRRGAKDPMYAAWSSPSTANPHVDPTAIEAERLRLPDETFRQEYLAEFVGSAVEPCDTCGGPSHERGGIVVVQGDDPIPVCKECERPLHDDGRCAVTVWPDGSPHVDIVREYGMLDTPCGTPDQFLPVELAASDNAARINPVMRPRWVLTPEEIERARAAMPPELWAKVYCPTPQ